MGVGCLPHEGTGQFSWGAWVTAGGYTFGGGAVEDRETVAGGGHVWVGASSHVTKRSRDRDC